MSMTLIKPQIRKCNYVYSDMYEKKRLKTFN